MDELLKQLDLRAISWRSLLLAGVFPASLLFACVLAFNHGWQGCIDPIQKLVHFKSNWKAISQEGISFIVLAGILVAARAPILAVYRRLPIPFVRVWFLRRNASKRVRAQLQKDQTLWSIDVALWHRLNFNPSAYMAEPVRNAMKIPGQSEIEALGVRVRDRVIHEKRFGWWRQRELRRTLGWLHATLATRCAVARTAAEFAQRDTTNQNDRNWLLAEKSLGFKAPGDWVYLELTRWRHLYASHERAKARIAELNGEEIHDAYARASRRGAQFPSAEWIEPTPLGNTMAALEDYAERRYGIETSLLWSRVESVLPKEQREALYGSQIGVYCLLNASAAMALAGVICLEEAIRQLFASRNQMLQHLLAVLFMFFLAWVFSRFAVYAATQLRYQIESRVDLYLPRWLAALGLVPTNVAERRVMIAALGKFVNGSNVDLPNFSLLAITDPALSFEKSK